jgi:hypothetical protein
MDRDDIASPCPGRNTRVYAPEEPDSGILLMNHSNKIEQSMAGLLVQTGLVL